MDRKIVVLVGLVPAVIILVYFLFIFDFITPSSSNTISESVPSETVSPRTLVPNISEWKTFTNRRYGYIYKYPNEGFTYPLPLPDELKPRKESQAAGIHAPIDEYQITLLIEEDNIVWWDYLIDIDSHINPFQGDELTVKEFAEGIWEMNKVEESETKKVSDLITFDINGLEVYQFETTETFSYYFGGWVLDEPTVYSFAGVNDDIVHIIEFSKRREEIGQKILSTFQLIPYQVE